MERILYCLTSLAQISIQWLIQNVHYPVYTSFNRSAIIAILNIHFIYQKCFNTSSCLNESSLSLRGRSWSVVLHFFFSPLFYTGTCTYSSKLLIFWEPSIYINNTIIYFFFPLFYTSTWSSIFSGCFFEDPLDITH